MATDPKELQLIEDKELTVEALEILQESLSFCIEMGMSDPESGFHNKILDLIEEVSLSETYGDLEEVIAEGKSVEKDLESWLATQGRSTLSLSWPRI